MTAVITEKIRTATERRPARTPSALRSVDCHCGQTLDVCSHTHCPRCGRTLPASA
ncbi:MAG TPA: hypothetical protein VFJ19_10400 [Nocardioidaceae bacterium]|nr:hypothetical protein [Nocardioidaceae bacterium]